MNICYLSFTVDSILNPVAVWPLSQEHGFTDISGNGFHAYSEWSLSYGVGPGGQANGAVHANNVANTAALKLDNISCMGIR